MRTLVYPVLLFLGACAGSTVTTLPTALPAIAAPVASSMTLRELQWRVTKKPDQSNTYALDDQGFEAMYHNLTEFDRYIREQQAIIEFYQKVTAPGEKG